MSELRRVTYTDLEGRKKDVYLPNGVDDLEATYGVPIGPPDLTDLGLPLETEVRLNNELHARGILTPEDAKKKRSELVAALMAALKVDAGKVFDIYSRRVEDGYEEPTKGQSDSTVPNRRQSRTRQRTAVPAGRQGARS